MARVRSTVLDWVQFYFNKPINELDVAEIATLISIIRGPSYYNPFRHPERALSRRNRILDTLQRRAHCRQTMLAQSRVRWE